MNQVFGAAGPSARVVALAIVIGVGMMTPVCAADDEMDAALSGAGKVWYEKYCTPCHGAGGGPGTAKSKATNERVDLRTYVRSHGGKFPVNDWLAVIADAKPGGEHAKVWRTIKQTAPGVAGKDAAARGVLASIARYIMSVQTQ